MKISIIKLVEVVSRYTGVPAVIPLRRPDLQQRASPGARTRTRRRRRTERARGTAAAAENYCAFFSATLVGGYPVPTTNRRRVNTM